uniref:Lipoprotein n=1 Tax=Arundo donax TaxID=35708 RepID=A0A0A9C4S0_ARUDO
MWRPSWSATCPLAQVFRLVGCATFGGPHEPPRGDPCEPPRAH